MTEPVTGRQAAAAPWGDLLAVAGLTSVVAALCVAFDLHELLFGFTRRFEWLQLDELPVILLTLALGLGWLALRRYREARITQARLQSVLAENRELAQQHLKVQEDERRRLARELHDELGQYLNVIKLDAVALMAGEPSGSREAGARQIIQSVDHVHGAVSDMIRRLRPAGLDELGLGAALEACVDHWRRRLPGTRFELTLRGELEDLGETLNLAIYRLIQEGLTNCYKHAQASHIQMFVERGPAAAGGEQVALRLVDNGVGAEARALCRGFGVGGMRERALLLGGEFAIQTAAGEGCLISASLPVPRDRWRAHE